MYYFSRGKPIKKESKFNRPISISAKLTTDYRARRDRARAITRSPRLSAEHPARLGRFRSSQANEDSSSAKRSCGHPCSLRLRSDAEIYNKGGAPNMAKREVVRTDTVGENGALVPTEIRIRDRQTLDGATGGRLVSPSSTFIWR